MKALLTLGLARCKSLTHFDVDLADYLLVALLISEPDQQNQALVHDQVGAISNSEYLREFIFQPLFIFVQFGLVVKALLKAGHEGL